METKIIIEQLIKDVKQLIKINLHNEVTSNTKKNISGIYMIYIDNFGADNIIPIYIGQAKDIQRRYKQHYTELLSLNRLDYNEYYNYFFSRSYSFYEGSFKTCKIFKYMVDNSCELKDFHMLILEEADKNQLDQKEQEYFNRLLPSFFGFNQLNSFLFGLKIKFLGNEITESFVSEYLDLLMNDINCIHQFYEYGFTRFNFEHSVPKKIDFLLIYSLIDNFPLQKYEEVKSRLIKLVNNNFSDATNLEERYKLIFPTKMFEPFSLKDKLISNDLLKYNYPSNICFVYFYISNNGINRNIAEYDKRPYIISVHYFYVDSQGRSIERRVYIKNETTGYCKNGIKYIEKDFYDLWAFKKRPFKITSLINKVQNQSCISILSEYKHGINDFTIQKAVLIDLYKVIDEIKEITNSKTEFIISRSESLVCLKECIRNEKLENDDFVKQVLLKEKFLESKKANNTIEKTPKVKKEKLTERDLIQKRTEAYKNKIRLKSNNIIEVLEYLSSKERVIALCNNCDHQWRIRADHLIARTYCPKCKKAEKFK